LRATVSWERPRSQEWTAPSGAPFSERQSLKMRSNLATHQLTLKHPQSLKERQKYNR